MKGVSVDEIDVMLDELLKQQNTLTGSLQRIQKMGVKCDNFPIDQLRLEEQKVLEAQERIRTILQFMIPDMERLNNDASSSSN